LFIAPANVSAKEEQAFTKQFSASKREVSSNPRANTLRMYIRKEKARIQSLMFRIGTIHQGVGVVVYVTGDSISLDQGNERTKTEQTIDLDKTSKWTIRLDTSSSEKFYVCICFDAPSFRAFINLIVASRMCCKTQTIAV